MSEIDFAMFAAAVATAGVVILTAATLPVLCIIAKRRIEKLEAEQAEIAAFVASELKRQGRLLARQRASEITSSLARATRVDAAAKRPAARVAASASAIHQPLRKTIH